MSTLLVINSSPAGEASTSRSLTQHFIDQWREKNPDGTLVERNLTVDTVPHLSGQTIGAFFTPADQRTDEQKQLIAQSDEMVAEVIAADVVVFGIPMHNFGVPSSLKAYIDHISRVGVTFKYTPTGPVGLVDNTKAVVISTRGGDYSETSPAASKDFINPYMVTFLDFIGITDVTLVGANGMAMGEDVANTTLANARQTIEQAIAA